MDMTMEMGKSAGMGNPPDMAKEKALMMEKEKMKAMIDGMGAEQLAAMSTMINEVNKPPDAEVPVEGEADDTALDWNEPRASADAKLAKMGM